MSTITEGRVPRAIYEASAEKARRAEDTVAARADRIGYLRLAYFFVWVGLAIYLFVDVGFVWGLVVAVLGLVGFGRLVGLQQAADAERARQRRITEINEGELESLAYRFDRFDGGSRYANALHPYTSDLDVFGPKSVYALVNRTVSLAGGQALASYMRHCLSDVTHIAERQAAVTELASALAWRHDFAAATPHEEQTAAQLDKLRAWARAEPQFLESYWAVLLVVVPLVNVLWLISFAYLPFMLALLGYAPTFWLLWHHRARVDEIEAATTESVAALRQLSGALAQISERDWESRLLAQLRTRVGTTDRAAALKASRAASASDQIARLATDVRQLAVRANPFVLVLNLFGLWEIRYARRIERWKVGLRQQGPVLAEASKHPDTSDPVDSESIGEKTTGDGTVAGQTAGAHVRADHANPFPVTVAFALPTALDEPLPPIHPIETWLLVAGAFDALNSMAGTMHRYPNWQMPEVVAQPATGAPALSGRGLHHPLLSPAKSVPNDFDSPLDTHVSLLTGSNMAGKSTLLRTIGLHLVMAQWGMPTPARHLSLSPVDVYTSMRTQDNLHEGASAFYAELNRLRIVVDATRAGAPVFFLLDEILKGTNSLDRNAGGRALIEQLLHYGGAGVVATHDLELGRLADETTAVSTLRLEVETDAAGELYFDYTVKPGLAQSRNASALMRKLGLGVV